MLSAHCMIRQLWVLLSLLSLGQSHPQVQLINTLQPDSFELPTQEIVNETAAIMCFPAYLPDLPVTVQGCKPTLDIIRGYRPYTKIQEFRQQYPESPRSPHKPPYTVDDPHADCSILIAPAIPKAISHFSWSQVKTLAQNVIEHCAEDGRPGKGGSGTIGEIAPGHDKPGWIVVIVGRKGEVSSTTAGVQMMSTAQAEVMDF